MLQFVKNVMNCTKRYEELEEGQIFVAASSMRDGTGAVPYGGQAQWPPASFWEGQAPVPALRTGTP